MASSNKLISLSIFLLLLCLPVFANQETQSTSSSQCGTESQGGCHDKAKALRFKLIAIASILIASMLGVTLPLFSSAVPALQPDRNLFVVVKAFSSGVILATGYMHVLPDSFDCLTSECLPENPWHKFPFTTFVAMLSAVFTLMVDSFSMSYYKKKLSDHSVVKVSDQMERLHCCFATRVVAQVLEGGIVVHSVVIGLAMGASDNPCTIRTLIAALCFHQLFEGMGLGGCILQGEYGPKMKAIMVFFFSVTTPFGIALGIGLSNVYSEDSPTALIVVGILNAASAGLLNYTALVDLLAADFMGAKLQGSTKLQIGSCTAVLLGAGGMSVMAIWA
ncbi:fe(2+) transport protein 1-like [Quillaja saponaria]|uniref:Fe(2+) transport protein 1-like n=1 Tax=Quillaja saponaria TaxID=32244 RepID=A0AAD7L9A6_QUISA|nr:fe(2+) transport protein 1-like [Quillaja saponaria]